MTVTTRRHEPAPTTRVRLADYDQCLPCGTWSARRRHLSHGQTCGTCQTDRIPERRPA